jgi:hypothetical protein
MGWDLNSGLRLWRLVAAADLRENRLLPTTSALSDGLW